MMTTVTTKKLTPQLWSNLETLFGSNGACGGCWCMWWRREKGATWDEIRGAANKRACRNLVKKGKAQGIIGYHRGEPVGWCSFGSRLDFPALARARTLKCDDAAHVWSIVCLFIKREYRNRSIGSDLVSAAVDYLVARKAQIIESYPVKPKKGETIPAAFASTGTVSMYKRLGFKPVGDRKAYRQRMRLRP